MVEVALGEGSFGSSPSCCWRRALFCTRGSSLHLLGERRSLEEEEDSGWDGPVGEEKEGGRQEEWEKRPGLDGGRGRGRGVLNDRSTGLDGGRDGLDERRRARGY